jgi:hypothetical protein
VDGESGGLGAIGSGGFREDVAHVIGDGIDTDKQGIGDLPVAFPGCDEAQYLDFGE